MYYSITFFALLGFTVAIATTIAIDKMSQKIYGQWKDDRRVLLGRDRVKGL